MSTYYLIEAVQLGSALYWPGTLVSDQYDDIVRLQSAGGSGVLWPSSDATVAAGAALAQSAKQRGDMETAKAAMISAVFASIKASGDVTAGRIPQFVTATIGFADFASLGAGVLIRDYLLGGVLPANAVLAGLPVADGFTGFDDATHGTYSVVVGTSAGGNQIGTALNVAAGQTGFPKLMSAGASGILYSSIAGAQLRARITGGVDLNTATAGAVTLKVPYAILPP